MQVSRSQGQLARGALRADGQTCTWEELMRRVFERDVLSCSQGPLGADRDDHSALGDPADARVARLAGASAAASAGPWQEDLHFEGA